VTREAAMAAFAKSWRREESFQQIIALSSVIDMCYGDILLQ